MMKINLKDGLSQKANETIAHRKLENAKSVSMQKTVGSHETSISIYVNFPGGAGFAIGYYLDELYTALKDFLILLKIVEGKND